MTFEEYNKRMDKYTEKLDILYGDDIWDDLYEEISKFQQEYMENVLEEYKKTIDCKAKECIYNLMHHAVYVSETGSSVIDVETEKLADEIDNILWEDIGDYLLDYEIYEEDNHWIIDCMFAGYYVPYWDGWCEV